jgi:hypothetical protein
MVNILEVIANEANDPSGLDVLLANKANKVMEIDDDDAMCAAYCQVTIDKLRARSDGSRPTIHMYTPRVVWWSHWYWIGDNSTHALIAIELSDGTVVLVDNRFIGGDDHLFFMEDIPWWADADDDPTWRNRFGTPPAPPAPPTPYFYGYPEWPGSIP